MRLRSASEGPQSDTMRTINSDTMSFARKQNKAAPSAAESMEKSAKVGWIADLSTRHERKMAARRNVAHQSRSTAKSDDHYDARPSPDNS